MIEDSKKIIKTAVFSLFFIFVLVYGLYRSHDLIVGMKIKDVSIQDGAVLETSVLEVVGNAKNAVLLTLNGREISVDQEGNFRETIALLSGYNLVSIKAEDKFGQKDEKNYKLIFKEHDQES